MNQPSVLSLQYLWGVLRQRWPVLAVTSAALFAGAAWYIFSLQPAYTADAVVLLAPTTEELSDEPDNQRLATTDPFFIRSEANIIGSDDLSREVIARLHLEQEPDFTVPADTLERQAQAQLVPDTRGNPPRCGPARLPGAAAGVQ